MTRGRLPVRAQDVADPIARKRGTVQHYQYEPGTVFSFTIFQKSCGVLVRIKCVRRLGGSVQELEREYAEILASVCLTASGPGITRELWLCSPRYALRFFRVTDAGLVELDEDGSVLGTGARPAGSPGAEVPGNAGATRIDKSAGTGTPPVVTPGTPAPG